MIDKVAVGSVDLAKARDGEIVGDLNLGRDGNPIPKDFPKVRKDTKVVV